MQTTTKAQLTEGPIIKTLVRLTIPMIIGILGMVIFNLVDTLFVGQLGTNELAAISFTFPVVMVIGSISMGLGVGVSAVISRAIGEGNHHSVQRLTTDSLSLGALIVVSIVAVGLSTIEPTFRMLGAEPEVMPLIKEYMLIWYMGATFIVVPMIGNSAIRATGDTKTPSAIMVVAFITNIILDPLLIFGIGPFPRWGLMGAAVATVTARFVIFLLSMWVLYFRENMITFQVPTFQEGLSSWKKVLYIGVPAAGTNLIMPVGMGIITSLVSVYGNPAVAALGVVTRVEMFALTMLMALGSVLAPFVGQNLGAGKKERIVLAVKYSQQFAMAWGGLMFILLLVLARPIASMFNDNPEVIANIILYLSLVPISYGLLSVLYLSNNVLNVLNKPLHAAVLMIMRMLVLYVPLSYVGSYLFGIQGIFGAASVANMIAGVAAYYWLNRILRSTTNKLL